MLSCDFEFSFQNQKDNSKLFLLDYITISKETCQDTWSIDTCKEMKKLKLCLQESVYTNCKKTCNKCDNDICKDKYPKKQCELFIGKCDKEFFYKKCMESCGKCPCKDMWDEKICNKHMEKKNCYLEEVSENCKKTCGKCPDLCKDIWDKKTCKKHKKEKECDLEAVAANCQKTCKLCTKPTTGKTSV